MDFQPYGMRSRPSNLWRSCIIGREVLELGMGWLLGKGKQMLLWKDVWFGDSSLASRFPQAFEAARNPTAKVDKYISGMPQSLNIEVLGQHARSGCGSSNLFLVDSLFPRRRGALTNLKL